MIRKATLKPLEIDLAQFEGTVNSSRELLTWVSITTGIPEKEWTFFLLRELNEVSQLTLQAKDIHLVLYTGEWLVYFDGEFKVWDDHVVRDKFDILED